MKITLNKINMDLSVKYRKNNEWIEAGDESPVRFTVCDKGTYYTYRLELISDEPTQVRVYLSLPGMKDYYHLIPCNIYGDNNAKDVKSGEFPLHSGNSARTGRQHLFQQYARKPGQLQ